MEKPSVSLSRWMLDQIEERRPKGTNRSQYIREALQGRFDAEDAGEWTTPEVTEPEGENDRDTVPADAD